MNKIINELLKAPDTQLDQIVKDQIKLWDNPPKSLQILHTLDDCVHGALCSDFCITVLQILLDVACKEENTTYDEVVKLADWRKDR